MRKHSRRPVLLLAALAVSLTAPLAAQQTFTAPRGQVEQISYEQVGGGVINIYYDLKSDNPSAVFAVSVTVKIAADGGRMISLTPKAIEGDVSSVKPGLRHKIVWQSGQDVEVLNFSQLQFEVVATAGPAVPAPGPTPPPAGGGRAAPPPSGGSTTPSRWETGASTVNPSDLRGSWSGKYSDAAEAQITFDRQDGSTYSGILTVVNKAGTEPSEIEVVATVAPDLTVELREIRVRKLGAAKSWNLGVGSGAVQFDGTRLTGASKDDKTTYLWSFARRGVGTGPAPASAAPPAPTAPTGTLADVRGSWKGNYAGADARLVVEQQNGSAFSGRLIITTKAGKDPTELLFEGTLTTSSIEIRETMMVKLGAAPSWNLGVSAGTLQTGGRQMSGTGKDGKTTYRWSLTRQ